MALAVSQLHDCEIIHCGISASLFKVAHSSIACYCLTMSFIANVFASQIFPIYESPTQRHRVKLVGLSKMTSTSNFQSDVQQLGETMEYLATQLPSATKLDLEAYDPSLHFLLKWMQNKEDPPTMHEVLRHPFFLSLLLSDSLSASHWAVGANWA